jgi:hypothetical protein
VIPVACFVNSTISFAGVTSSHKVRQPLVCLLCESQKKKKKHRHLHRPLHRSDANNHGGNSQQHIIQLPPRLGPSTYSIGLHRVTYRDVDSDYVDINIIRPLRPLLRT